MENQEKIKPLRFNGEILEIKSLSPSVKHFKISVSPDFKFIPGQYISLIMEKDSQKFRRPYSIVSDPITQRNYLELCIKILENGVLTPLLDKKEVGEILEFLGPLGEFTLKDKDKNLVFISTGVGIAPFRSIINNLLNNNFKSSIILLAGYRDEDGILYHDEFKDLENKHKNFIYHHILSRNTNADERGRVQNLIDKHITEETSQDTDFYICGLKDMINSVRIQLKNKGISLAQVYSEKFD